MSLLSVSSYKRLYPIRLWDLFGFILQFRETLSVIFRKNDEASKADDRKLTLILMSEEDFHAWRNLMEIDIFPR